MLRNGTLKLLAEVQPISWANAKAVLQELVYFLSAEFFGPGITYASSWKSN